MRPAQASRRACGDGSACGLPFSTRLATDPARCPATPAAVLQCERSTSRIRITAALQLAVYLRTQQQDDQRQPDPCEKSHGSAQIAVNPVVTSVMLDIPGEQVR